MTTTVSEKPMAALFEHCCSVFDTMWEEGSPEETDPAALTGEGPWPSQTETSYRVWEGFTTSLFNRLEFSTPYYTAVMRALRDMGCVEQLRRGGGNSKSKWRLVRRPAKDAFDAASKRVRPAQGSHAALKQQVSDLQARVLTLEKAVGIYNE